MGEILQAPCLYMSWMMTEITSIPVWLIGILSATSSVERSGPVSRIMLRISVLNSGIVIGSASSSEVIDTWRSLPSCLIIPSGWTGLLRTS